MTEITMWDYCVGALITLGIVGLSLLGWYITVSGTGLWLKPEDLDNEPKDLKAKELKELNK